MTTLESTPDRATTTPVAREVLVIEDDLDLRSMLAEILEAQGCHVHVASTGIEGLSLLRAGRDQLSLVLLDLGIDGINGFELLAQQARDPSIGAIPVVVMSGRDQIDDRGRPTAWVHTLHKPVSLDDLSAAVARYAR